MTNVRKLMARLNPPTKPMPAGEERARFRNGGASIRRALEEAGKYDGGGPGRAPELLQGLPSPTAIPRVSQTRSVRSSEGLTPQDIAAALAFVRDPLARDIFCHLWWPDGAANTRRQLNLGIESAMLREYEKREHERAAAALALHMLQTYGSGTRSLTAGRRDLSRARTRRFPAAFSGYAAVRDAVLDELGELNHCELCNGRGEARVGALIIKCDLCKGEGIVPVSARERAEAIGKSYTTFRDWWAGLYAWTFAFCRNLEQEAAEQVRAALAS